MESRALNPHIISSQSYLMAILGCNDALAITDSLINQGEGVISHGTVV